MVVNTLTKAPAPLVPAVANLVNTTPRRLTAFLAVCLLSASVMGIVAYTTYAGIQGATQTVGKDAAPSVVAAEHIQALVADADASALNAVLTNDRPNGPSWTQYRSDMDTVQDELITASQNITYGNAERGPIFTMASNLNAYAYTMGQTLGKSITDANPTLTAGHQLFQQQIRPASVALDQTNYAHLSQKYTAHRDAIGWQMGLVWLSMLLLISVLGIVQYYLFRRTHRVLNTGFAAATMIAVLFMIYTLVALNAGEAQLVAAKQSSFDSINALWSARAVAYTMNADESLYLLHYGDNSALAQAQADYTHYRQQMTSVDPQKAFSDAQNGTAFGGYLGIELSNITYPGERDAAVNAVKAWTDYTNIDAQMRQLLSQGKYAQAMTIDLGTNVGQSDWAFARFDAALGQVITINQAHFNQQVSDAFGILRPFPFVLSGVLIALILACVFGMKPRLEEYWR